jgi:hypothetical protein
VFSRVLNRTAVIRNNCFIKVFGKGVKVETLARDLDRQILALSEEMPKDK